MRRSCDLFSIPVAIIRMMLFPNWYMKRKPEKPADTGSEWSPDQKFANDPSISRANDRRKYLSEEHQKK